MGPPVPIGEVAGLRDLKASEQGHIQVPTPDHCEGHRRVEKRRAGIERYLLTTCINEVWVFFILAGHRADADDTVSE